MSNRSSIYVTLPLFSVLSVLASVVLHDESLIEVTKIESHPPAAVFASHDDVHSRLRHSCEHNEQTQPSLHR